MVYDRPPHYFTAKDTIRILRKEEWSGVPPSELVAITTDLLLALEKVTLRLSESLLLSDTTKWDVVGTVLLLLKQVWRLAAGFGVDVIKVLREGIIQLLGL